MAEPEEESDEEWQLIADAVGIFEQQFNHARATAVTGAAPTAAPTDAEASSPMAPTPVPQPIVQSLIPPISQPVKRTRSHPPVSEIAPPSVAPVVMPDPRVAALETALASLRSENGRLRLAEASTASTAASLRAKLAQMELQQKERENEKEQEKGGMSEISGRVPLATQAGDVVEPTQTGLDLLKECVRPRLGRSPRRRQNNKRERDHVPPRQDAPQNDDEESLQQEGSKRSGFGTSGLDEAFRQQMLRERVFGGRYGDGLLRVAGMRGGLNPADISSALAGDDWKGLTRGLVGLLRGDAWGIGMAGLRAVLVHGAARREAAVCTDVINGISRGLDDDATRGTALAVLESVAQGCAEVGAMADETRAQVLSASVEDGFARGETAAARVVDVAVTGALEAAAEERVGEEEWGRVERALACASRLASDGVVGEYATALLLRAAVLAPHLAARFAATDAALGVVVDGVIAEDEGRIGRGLAAARACLSAGVGVSPAARLVALAFLVELEVPPHDVIAALMPTKRIES